MMFLRIAGAAAVVLGSLFVFTLFDFTSNFGGLRKRAGGLRGTQTA